MADLNLKAGTNITLEQQDSDLYINSTTEEPDLSNYYTKSETYSKTEVDDIVGDIGEVLDEINGESI